MFGLSWPRDEGWGRNCQQGGAHPSCPRKAGQETKLLPYGERSLSQRSADRDGGPFGA